MKELTGIISPPIPKILVEKLQEHYREMKHNYFLGRYEPSEINGAKFAEVVIRILEWTAHEKFTPIGTKVSLDKVAKDLMDNFSGKIDEFLRIIIPRALRAIYDIRNRRGVAHVAMINPNMMDATLVISVCDWIIAELVRFFTTVSVAKAQKIVDGIVQRKAPIVEEFNGQLLVLNPKLSVANQILLLLYQKYPDYVSTMNLQSWIKTKHETHVSTSLNQQIDKKLVYQDTDNKLTLTGIKLVEEGFSKGKFKMP